MTYYKKIVLKLVLFAWWFSSHTILITAVNYLIENYIYTILMIFGIEFVMFCIITWFAGFVCRRQIKKVKEIWTIVGLAFIIWGLSLVGIPFALQSILAALNFDWTKPIMPPGLFGQLVSGMIYETSIAGVLVVLIVLCKTYCTRSNQMPIPSAPPIQFGDPPPYSEIV